MLFLTRIVLIIGVLNLINCHAILVKTFIELPMNTHSTLNHIQWDDIEEIKDIFQGQKKYKVKYKL